MFIWGYFAFKNGDVKLQCKDSINGKINKWNNNNIIIITL